MKNKSLNFLKVIIGYNLALLVVFGGLGFISSGKANAATISATSQTARVGQSISVPIVANGISIPVSGWTLAGIYYDHTKLDFTGYTVGSIPITSNDKYVTNGRINISWFDNVDSPVRVSENPVLITLNFVVLSPLSTTTKISFAGNLDVSDVNGVSLEGISYQEGLISLNPELVRPNPPTSVLAFAGNGFASVQFRPATTTASSTIVRYTITSYPGNISVNGVTSPILVTGLTNGVSYTFRVTSTDANGNTSEPSVESNVVRPTNSDRVPGVPTNLEAIPGNGQVALSWSAPSSSEELPFGATYTSNIFTAILSYFRPAPVITDYIVEYKVTGATTTWIRYNDGVSTSQSALVRGLNNSTSYSFVVSAEVNGKVGSASNVAYATPRDLNARPVVTITAVPNPILSASSANIIWSSTNSTSCSISRSGTSTPLVSGATAGQVSTGPLFSNTIFTVTCLGRDGLLTATSSVSVNISIPSSRSGGVRVAPVEIEEIDSEPVIQVPPAPPAPIPPTEQHQKATSETQILYQDQSRNSLTGTIFNAILRMLGI
jgi:hypothetical protein